LRAKADLYHFHDPELIPVGLLLVLLGRKVVYDVHEDFPLDILSKYYLPAWLRMPIAWFVRAVEAVGAACFSGLVTVTPNIAHRFKTYNSSTVVVHNYPRLQELGPTRSFWQTRQSAVAYVGGMLVERGVREMVKAMVLLPDHLHATLELARDDFPDGLYEEVSAYPGWAKVRDWGSVDRAQIADILGRVRGGLVLFHPEPNNIRAMPHKLFEYMAASIPVIASDFPLWRSIIEGAKCGLLVNPFDPHAIAQAVEYVLTHPDEAEQMGKQGRAAVEKQYNWEMQEEVLFNLYTNVLAA
jgi:glycosyltransferase involved in cell wall biosynthesis